MLSLNNSKLKKDGIAAFGLPAGHTCPGAGTCKRFCYACKGMYRFPCVEQSRFSNLMATFNLKAFVADMIAEVDKIKHKIKAIRIHDSGDFYTQAYLDAWVKIAKAQPTVKFYCYTTSLHLDWSKFDSMPNMHRTQSQSSVFKALTNKKLSTCVVDETGSNSDQSDLNSLEKMIKKQVIKLKKR